MKKDCEYSICTDGEILSGHELDELRTVTPHFQYPGVVHEKVWRLKGEQDE